jgi:alpha-N-arabinofuranosidase
MAGALILVSLFVHAQKESDIVVNADKIQTEIQPTMWGVFFEDINFGADGGLYAELVKNRSFEFYNPKTGWTLLSKATDSSLFNILSRGTTNEKNPRFARLAVGKSTEPYCLSNGGFRGMGVKKDLSYSFSLMAALHDAGPVNLRVELVDSKGRPAGGTSLTLEGTEWKKYTAGFTATVTDPKASLKLWFGGKGTVDMDMVSLFPADTWKNRPNGLRADLVQMLADMKPGFLRFPGGCIVEGHELSNRYQWKNTIGDISERQLIVNRWNTEFRHRPTPDYFQSFGLGFFEFFQLAGDIGAEPLPILNCGMSCQFNTGEMIAVDQLDPYIQDALDLIEFANGTADSGWGKIRAQMGHPAPFNMKFLGVGNEQWGPQYFERYALFEKAIRDRYPGIKIVSGTGPFPDGDLFDYARQELQNLGADIVDEHYYRDPAWFRNNATRYDSYDRKLNYRIFAGEYAAQSVAVCSPLNKNNWECALAEAAFMTGLERNADMVHMCSYAPLFAHAEGWQWTPDLIWFDNLNAYGTPNYYVQQLFSVNKGTHLLEILKEGKPLTGQNGLYASAALDKNSREIIVKMVNTTGNTQVQKLSLQSSKKTASKARIIILQNDQPASVNSLAQPSTIKPVEEEIALKGKTMTLSIKPYSLSVIKIKQQ